MKVTWNVRGLGKRIKRKVLRKMLLSVDPILAFIQESKLENVTPKLQNSFWSDNDLNIIASPSNGSSGGLISLWRPSKFQLTASRIETQWIGIEGIMVREDFQCLLINIYNSCDPLIRSNTWSAIEEFCNTSHLPILIAGDFNEVLIAKDRGSMVIDESSSAKFREFMSNLHLTEISPSNGYFTWFRGKSKSKLIEYLFNQNGF
ncbi:uncharacterized protein LOC125491701 [Beta vulgaris subsp. vulgaris]|uniref:uncharacterized protein LOC125491701 n=1 Tax=Beta vulgaris subsp. vulgaris TaxID=3555 RepID=UPI002036B4DE|nr:uncharacterized protein LOC125491701 [Beta vulgaris subsp. vulgaris]